MAPTRRTLARHPYVGGIDLIAGGTWLAVDPGTAAFAALLNGPPLPATASPRPTRGTLIVARDHDGAPYGSTSATLLGLRDGSVRYDFTANPGPDAVWQEIAVRPFLDGPGCHGPGCSPTVAAGGAPAPTEQEDGG